MCSRDDFPTAIIDARGAIKIEIRDCPAAAKATCVCIFSASAKSRIENASAIFARRKFDRCASNRENFFADALW
jgi:hypothetical protein